MRERYEREGNYVSLSRRKRYIIAWPIVILGVYVFFGVLFSITTSPVNFAQGFIAAAVAVGTIGVMFGLAAGIATLLQWANRGRERDARL